MFASVRRSAAIIFDPAFLRVVLKAIGLTLLLFIILFAAAEYAVRYIPVSHMPEVAAAIPVVTAILSLFLAIFLGPPVAALFATLFVEDIARAVEAKDYPNDPAARGAPFWQSLLAGLRLFGWVVLLNILLLPIELFLPGPGQLIGLLVNGWLLGREYFELVALRHMSRTEVNALRRRRSGPITMAGGVIALLSAIPIINLAAPLFGVTLMVHEFKRYSSGAASA